MLVITTENKKQWNEIVKSFSHWDIYYLCEYAKSLELNGDGKAYLIYYKQKERSICYVIIEKDIANSTYFFNHLQKDIWFDWETPYGYGAFLENGKIDKKFIENFLKELKEYCEKKHIVSQFLRFHPLISNYKNWEITCDVKHLKQTIFIDTSSEELIMKNMDRLCRNRVRKALKNGVTIQIEEKEHLEEFIDIYKQTMIRNNADDYYFFDQKYFDYIFDSMKNNIKLFCAYYENKIIGAVIFFFNENYMHYHLSGMLEEYKSLASINLLTYQAAVWASQRGIKALHLGGGVGKEDSLFHFKEKFNKNGKIDFCIGRNIFDKKQYENLMQIRRKTDESFEENNKLMIQYRYEK